MLLINYFCEGSFVGCVWYLKGQWEWEIYRFVVRVNIELNQGLGSKKAVKVKIQNLTIEDE